MEDKWSSDEVLNVAGLSLLFDTLEVEWTPQPIQNYKAIQRDVELVQNLLVQNMFSKCFLGLKMTRYDPWHAPKQS